MATMTEQECMAQLALHSLALQLAAAEEWLRQVDVDPEATPRERRAAEAECIRIQEMVEAIEGPFCPSCSGPASQCPQEGCY
jgi:hypothetical protein